MKTLTPQHIQLYCPGKTFRTNHMVARLSQEKQANHAIAVVGALLIVHKGNSTGFKIQEVETLILFYPSH